MRRTSAICHLRYKRKKNRSLCSLFCLIKSSNNSPEILASRQCTKELCISKITDLFHIPTVNSFLLLISIPFNGYTIVYSPTKKYQGCLQLGTIKNKTAIKIDIRVFFSVNISFHFTVFLCECKFSFHKCLGLRFLNHMVNIHLTL